MDFSYSENHIDLKNLAEQILKDFSSPEYLEKLEASGKNWDKELWENFLTAGIPGAAIPETFNGATVETGMGMDFHAVTLIAESIGRHAVRIPYISSVASVITPLLSLSNQQAVSQLLHQFIPGGQFPTAALIEPGNENPFTPLTRAEEKNNNWILHGAKHCVPYAADASQLLLAAQTSKGLWLGLVSSQQTGIKITPQQCTVGEAQYHIELNEAAGVCLATGDHARELLQKSVAMTTVAYCAMAIGVADKMTRLSAEYTSAREQFGVKIATFQAVAHKLANAYIDVECLKSITLRAANDIHQNQVKTDSLSMAKIWCGDVLHRVSHTAQHVHGGTGIDRSYPLFRYCLWAKQLELSLGNSKMHLAKLADSIEEHTLKKIQLPRYPE